MINNLNLSPIKQVIIIINSCENKNQLKSCNNVINNYIRLLTKNGIINPKEVKDRLYKEYNQKLFQLSMIKSHIVKHQVQKIKIAV